jgi:hypothetical protein
MLILIFTALVAALTPRRSGFVLRYYHVGFMGDKLAVGQGYHLGLSSSAVSVIPKTIHTHLLLQVNI